MDQEERTLGSQDDASLLRAIFELSADAIMILDGQSRIVRANAAAAAQLGLPLEQVVGVPCFTVMHRLPGPVAGCPHAQCMRSRRREEAEVYDEKRDAWLAVMVDPILDGAGNITGIIHTVKDITARRRAEREVLELKDRLQQENVYLREEVQVLHHHSEIVGQSEAVRRVLTKVEQVAAANSTVLLLGETGTGKELLATAIHNLSSRGQRTMVKVNCAALPGALIESELFGREKGAYTGALTKQLGRFEMADKSTLFLDEVGELPAELQAKLLRVLESGEMQRLGSPKTIKVDVRVIAATNRDLAAAVREGKFRQDLYYRLNVFPITIPPLRQRTEDIPALVRAFVREFSKTTGKKIESISKRSLDKLMRYGWPGNIRELRNAVERAMIVCAGPTLEIDLAGTMEQKLEQEVTTLEECQRRHIEAILERTRWRIRGEGGAAELLGMKPTTLESLLSRLGIYRDGRNSEIS